MMRTPINFFFSGKERKKYFFSLALKVSFFLCTDQTDVAKNVYEVDEEIGGGEEMFDLINPA